MLHTKFQGHQSNASKEVDFLRFLPYMGMAAIRAREIDKCKLVQPFHKQSAISVSLTETTDRPFPRSWKLPIGSFRNDRPFPNIR